MPSSSTKRQSSIWIRTAAVADAPAIARVHVDSWRSTYQGIVAGETLAGLSYEARTCMWQQWLEKPPPGTCLFVAGNSQGVLGFASAGPARQPIGEHAGEVFAIYVVQHAQGMGVGRALMHAAAAHLLAQGCRSLLLWVLKDNTPARRFYEALGGVYLREQPIKIGTQTLLEVAYGWEQPEILTKEE